MFGSSQCSGMKQGGSGRSLYAGAAIIGVGLLVQVGAAVPGQADGPAVMALDVAAAESAITAGLQAHDDKKGKRKKKPRRGSFFSG